MDKKEFLCDLIGSSCLENGIDTLRQPEDGKRCTAAFSSISRVIHFFISISEGMESLMSSKGEMWLMIQDHRDNARA